jgi:hypothetical protein
MPCGPTRQQFISDVEFLLDNLDKCLAMLNKYEGDMHRRQYELERRLARIEAQASQDDLDWSKVTGQGKIDDRSDCY